MNCEKYLDLISARLDGELTAQEEAALTAHLNGCPACRAAAEELEGLHSALGSLGEVAAPAELSLTVMRKIKGERSAARRRFVRRISGLAACLILCVGIYQLAGAESPDVDPNLPDVARHVDPQPFALSGSETDSVSGEQRLRLSDTATFLEPTAYLLNSPEGLARFLTRFSGTDLSEETALYDSEYFQTRRLLTVVVQEPSSSISHTITSVKEDGVTLTRHVPSAGDCDMALWLILAQIDGTGPERELNVHVSSN